MPFERRRFIGGLDQDSEQRDVANGSYVFALNVRGSASSEDSDLGAIENSKGNLLIDFNLPVGTNRVIGSAQHDLKRKVYYFIFNSNADHLVLEYDRISDVISEVARGSVLNFKNNSLINDVDIVKLDEDNDLMYWSDRGNPPRKININKGKNGDYPSPLTEDIIDAIKYPPLCSPTSKYITDTSRSINFLSNKLVQFKARYVYDDYEKSAYSPISVLPLPSTTCTDSDSKINNGLEVTIPKGGVLVTRLEIVARFGNLGDFFLIEDDDIASFSTDTNGDYLFSFFNEKVYNTIEVNESIKLFDQLPRVAGSQEYIDGNRIVYGDVLEQFDQVKINASLSLSFNEAPTLASDTSSVKGTIRITNPMADLSNFAFDQPIHDGQNGQGPVFGGIGSANVVNTVGSDYQQSIPLSGFVVYLVGTDYKDISKQASSANNSANQNGDNVYNSDSGGGRRGDLRDDIKDRVIDSSFSIDGVPDGTYILRVASHLTTDTELSDPSRSYQKSSTYVYSVGGNEGFEVKITVSGSNVTVGEILIADLTEVGLVTTASAISGYVTDMDNTITDTAEALADTRVELCEVGIINASNTLLPYNSTVDDSYITKQWKFGRTYSDANGFFFFTAKNAFPTVSGLDIFQIYSNGFSLNPTGYKFETASLTTFDPVTGSDMKIGIFRNTNQDVSDFARTVLTGTIVDTSGTGVSDVNVTVTRGDSQESDSSGNFSIFVYEGSTDSANGVSPSNTRTGFIVFSSSSAICPLSFDFDSLALNIAIGQNFFNALDSSNYVAVTPNPIATILAINNTIQADKRGGEYNYGLVYYDRANRSGTTNTSDSLNLPIPFYTELFNGAIQNAGIPIVDWQINHTPPIWATHYQWVRTPNTATNKYIQFAAKSVAYEDESGGASTFSDGTIIALDVSNIAGEYKTAHPDSILVYDFVEGDRIRFIRNAQGNLFSEYFDLKILSFTAGVVQVENLVALGLLSAGVLFELYTPKLDVETQIYYEIGERFDIGDSGLSTRFHEGLTQNQSSTLPAKGTFRTGDAYYRLRSMILDSADTILSYIDDANFSDFFDSVVDDRGRPNIVDLNSVEVRRPTTIYYSDRFIPETKINGLNSYFDTSFESYDHKYGAIQKMFSIDKRLDVYQETKVGKVLVNENVIFDQFDQGTVGASEKVLSDIIYFRGEYGIGTNPESFAEYGGRRYFVDIFRGVALRLSNDGITVISNVGMRSYFDSKSKQISENALEIDIHGVFFKDMDEYIISFQETDETIDIDITGDPATSNITVLPANVSSRSDFERIGKTGSYSVSTQVDNDTGKPIITQVVRDITTGVYVIESSTINRPVPVSPFVPETLSFSERIGRWTTFYSWLPENVTASGVDIVSFKDGSLYLHNRGDLYNNFYGVQYNAQLSVVFNQDPHKVKVYQALSEDSTKAWLSNDISTPQGQLSNLIEEDFELKEDVFYAAFWKDSNTPNVDFPLINGDDLRSQSLLVKLFNADTEFVKLYSVACVYNNSERSNK